MVKLDSQNKYIMIDIAIILFGIVFTILLNILIYKYLVNKAIKKYILPYLIVNKLKFIKVIPVRIFSTGDFPNNGIRIRPFSLGFPMFSIYLYVYYYNIENITIKRTVKVSCILFFIKKIEFSKTTI